MGGFTFFDTCYNSIRYFTYGPCNAAQEGNFRFRYGVTNDQDILLNYTIFSYYDVAVGFVQFDSFSLNPHSSTTRYVTRTLTICGDMTICGDTDNGNTCNNNHNAAPLSATYLWQTIPACLTGTPTAAPTPTSCSLAIQSLSFSGSGTPLINDYNTTQYKGSPQYTVVNSTKTGKVTKAEIYATLDRNIPKGGKVLQCKITNSTGTTDLGESTTNNGAFTKGVSWMGVQFTTPVNLVNGTSYRLYCKVNNVYGGGSIYWLDNYKNRTDKAYRLYICD